MEADTSGLICIAGPLTRERPAKFPHSPWLSIVDDEVLDSFDESI